MKTPNYVKKALLQAYKNPSLEGFQICCENTQKWFFNNLGVQTDSPIFNVDGSNIQFKWGCDRFHIPYDR